MNMKKMKKFFTLTRRNDGFTLVELIVVIAILAILGGVAVPAYSGYVKKANMQADITLASEVADALTLYYYSHPNENATGYVVLGQDGTGCVADSVEMTTAMNAVFGVGWENNLGLKYDGWVGDSADAYADTNFAGYEKYLVEKVDVLTNALQGALTGGMADTVAGTGFATWLKETYGIDATDPTQAESVSNAAVLYVSGQMNQDEFINDCVKQTFDSYGPVGFVQNLDDALMATDDEGNGGMGQLATAATTYACIQGFANFVDSQWGNNTASETYKMDFSSTDEFNDAMGEIGKGYQALINLPAPTGKPSIAELAEQYFNTDTQKNIYDDVKGMSSVMDTVRNNKDIIEDKMDSAECFSDGDIYNLVAGYAQMSKLNITTQNGQIAVALVIVDGVPQIHYLPLNLNK